MEHLYKLERARLADFGLSRKLEEGKTTVYTDIHMSWYTRLGSNGDCESDRKGPLQIELRHPGILTDYILSDGKHPFGDGVFREVNISEGKYFLGDIQDIAAKDLIEWMINKEQDKRPTVDKVLDHPYFWDDKREEQFYEEKMIDEFPDFFISIHKLAMDMGWEY